MNIYVSRIASTVSLIFMITCGSAFAQRPSDIWVADTVTSTVHKFVRK